MKFLIVSLQLILYCITESLRITMNVGDQNKNPISYYNDISKRKFKDSLLLVSNIILQNTAYSHIVNAATTSLTTENSVQKTDKLSSLSKSVTALADLSKPPYINGEKVFIDGVISKYRGETSIVSSPIIDEKTKQRTIIGKIAQMNKLDVIKVVESSEKAWKNGQGIWPQMSPAERIFAMENVIKGLKEKRSEIIQVLMWEICKTLRDATSEFDRTVEYMEATIEAYKQMNGGSSWKSINGIYAFVRRAAIGIMLCMGPYNYPFNETYATLIPALLLGNVAILKLPTIGGLAHILTMEIFAKSLPKGTINFVSGSGRVTVGPMMKTGKIDILAFIGGSQAADLIIKEHPYPHRLTVYLGLEAKNVGLVLPDADLDEAVQEILTGTLSYNGQRCTAIKLTIVHKSIIKSFLEKFKEKLNMLKIGLPWQEGVNITPLPEGLKKIEYLQSLIIDAKSKGGNIININNEQQNSGSGGGQIINESLMIPALIYPVTSDMRLWSEEQFGPIVPVASYNDINKVINYFQTTLYGQQISIFTKNVKALAPLVDILSTSVGRININTQCSRGPDVLPFTGRKSSSLGSLSVTESLELFSIETVIAAKESETNYEILNQLSQQSKFLSD